MVVLPVPGLPSSRKSRPVRKAPEKNVIEARHAGAGLGHALLRIHHH